MKIKLYTFTLLISFLNLNAQNELRISLNSGLFSYTGSAANRTSEIYIYNNKRTGYTDNPYGTDDVFSYGLSLNFKSISKSNIVYGIDTGYEILKSNVSIYLLRNFTSSPFPGAANITGDAAASGKTVVTSSVINLNPFFGKRFKSKNIDIDVVGGFDVCYILSEMEKGQAHIIGNPQNKYTTNLDLKTINFDFRPRAQISLDFNRIGVYVGYSYGLISHSSEDDNINNDVKSRFIRFGLTGKIF